MEYTKDLQKLFLEKQAEGLIKEISFIDHHTCHAHYSAFAPNIKENKSAIITLDSEGDGINQTFWIFDKKKNSFVMNNKKIKYLIDGYETIRTISKKEKDALNILCRGAALRYLLTRIYDYFNTPKTALIQVKEPNEYFQKLIIHNNLNSYKDYYK